ncbi:hypothetical protein QQ045_007257 [Rhodiola kirilowii]
MAKKRKADASRLDEVDRNLYANFRSAANALSQLYSQTVTQQRLSFESGQRHALEKLEKWISKQREEGSQVTTHDIVAHIKDEIEYGTDDIPSPLNNNSSQCVSQPTHSDAPVSCNIPPSANVGFDQQVKNSMFPNGTSHVRQSLQQYHLTDDGSHYNLVHLPDNIHSGNRTETDARGQMHIHSEPPHSSDDCTDMQTDDPCQKSAYRFFKHE